MRITVRAKPRTSQSRLVAEADGTFTAFLQAGPVDGAANAELLRLVAAHVGVPRSAVSIHSGATSRNKILDIDLPT